jgi:hypothetical protein
MESIRNADTIPIADAVDAAPVVAERGLPTPKGGGAPRRRGRRSPLSAKMTAFLAVIEVIPMVTRAANAARIHRSSHYEMMKSNPAYAEAFQMALQIGLDTISDLAVDRAVLGWEEPVVYRGRIATRKDPDTGALIPLTLRQYDNHLLMFLLKHRDPAYQREPPGAVQESSASMAERLAAGRRRVAEARQRLEEASRTDA